MSFDPHKNFAYSTVATAPSPASSGTTLVPADSTVFPTVGTDGAFDVVVWPADTAFPTNANAEIFRVTAGTTTWTISRTQQSTSARSIVAGDQIALAVTAKTMTDVENAAALIAPASSARNVIQPSAADAVALTLKGHATQTADLFKITTGADAVLQQVTSAGQLSVGSSLITNGYSDGHSVLQVHDVGLTVADEALIEVFAPNQRGGIHFYNVDDNFAGFYPWFWMLNEYNSANHIGNDALAFWYGLHTPDTEPAHAVVFFSRNGDSDGWRFGAQADTYDDAVLNGLEHFFIDESGGSIGSYPLRLYPGQRWRFKASLLEDANLAAGEFTWGYDDDNTNPTLTIRAKTADGTLASATIPLTPA